MREVTFWGDSDHGGDQVIQFSRTEETNARTLRAQHPRQLPYLSNAGRAFILQSSGGGGAALERDQIQRDLP